MKMNINKKMTFTIINVRIQSLENTSTYLIYSAITLFDQFCSQPVSKLDTRKTGCQNEIRIKMIMPHFVL